MQERSLVRAGSAFGSWNDAASLSCMKYVILTFALVASACSVSGEVSIGTPTIENATEDFIEDSLAEEIGLGELTANCSKPATEDTGTRFLCTAATEDGETIEFQALVEDDGSFVESTNVVLAKNFPEISATLIAEVEELSGVDLEDDALDCGTKSLVVDDENQIVCQLTDPIGEVFETTITFKGLDTDNATFDFFVDTGA